MVRLKRSAVDCGSFTQERITNDQKDRCARFHRGSSQCGGNTIGNTAFGYDVGVLYYYYPGTHSTVVAPGTIKANTTELYGSFSWNWLSAKINYAVSNGVFGVRNADGTYYLDFGALYQIPNTRLSLIAHYGIQKFTGSTGSFDNDTNASYQDWKLGGSTTLPKDFTIGAYYTDTSMNDTRRAFYTNTDDRFLGDSTGTVYVSKSF